MYARITTIHLRQSGHLDRIREAAPQLWLGAMAQPGCLGGFVLADPVAATIHAITFWNTAEEILAARGSAGAITEAAASALDADRDLTVVQILDVIGLDLDAVLASANRRGEQWPVIRANSPTTASRTLDLRPDPAQVQRATSA